MVIAVFGISHLRAKISIIALMTFSSFEYLAKAVSHKDEIISKCLSALYQFLISSFISSKINLANNPSKLEIKLYLFITPTQNLTIFYSKPNSKKNQTPELHA